MTKSIEIKCSVDLFLVGLTKSILAKQASKITIVDEPKESIQNLDVLLTKTLDLKNKKEKKFD